MAVKRHHKGSRLLVLVADFDMRIIAEEGTTLRQFELDPLRDFQPLGKDVTDN